MPKIRIFTTRDSWSDAYGDDHSYTVLSHGITDWVEVTSEEYKYLQDHKWRLFPGENVIVVQQPAQAVVECIKDVKAFIAADMKKRAEELLEKQRKAEERKLKKLAKNQEERRRLFEKLKKELGEA